MAIYNTVLFLQNNYTPQSAINVSSSSRSRPSKAQMTDAPSPGDIIYHFSMLCTMPVVRASRRIQLQNLFCGYLSMQQCLPWAKYPDWMLSVMNYICFLPSPAYTLTVLSWLGASYKKAQTHIEYLFISLGQNENWKYSPKNVNCF